MKIRGQGSKQGILFTLYVKANGESTIYFWSDINGNFMNVHADNFESLCNKINSDRYVAQYFDEREQRYCREQIPNSLNANSLNA